MRRVLLDPLCENDFAHCPRIIDYYHAAAHLHEVARAVHPDQPQRAGAEAEALTGLLYAGQVDEVIERMKLHQRQAGGQVQEQDGPAHPRRVGSGVTESGVKLMNKRVKGTEQFWRERNVETILTLRCLWLSQDQRWQHYWLGPRVQRQAA